MMFVKILVRSIIINDYNEYEYYRYLYKIILTVLIIVSCFQIFTVKLQTLDIHASITAVKMMHNRSFNCFKTIFTIAAVFGIAFAAPRPKDKTELNNVSTTQLS